MLNVGAKWRVSLVTYVVVRDKKWWKTSWRLNFVNRQINSIDLTLNYLTLCNIDSSSNCILWVELKPSACSNQSLLGLQKPRGNWFIEFSNLQCVQVQEKNICGHTEKKIGSSWWAFNLTSFFLAKEQSTSVRNLWTQLNNQKQNQPSQALT